MRDIDQFRQLMKGKTDSINTDQVIPKAPQKEMKKWNILYHIEIITEY